MKRETDASTMLSRRLPPAEAWRQPDKWIDIETGYVKPDIKKLQLPLDDRLFVKTDEAVQLVKGLFWEDYEWQINPRDPELMPDDHHFQHARRLYMPDQHEGSVIPIKFRELPPRIGRMPRQIHNTFHDLTEQPPMPEIDAMQEYVDSYHLVRSAFSKLFRAAHQTVEAQKLFPARRQDIIRNPDRLAARGHDDIGEAFLTSHFARHHKEYKIALEDFTNIKHLDFVPDNFKAIEKNTPNQVAKALGRVVNRTCIDYVPAITRS